MLNQRKLQNRKRKIEKKIRDKEPTASVEVKAFLGDAATITITKQTLNGNGSIDGIFIARFLVDKSGRETTTNTVGYQEPPKDEWQDKMHNLIFG